MKIFTKLIIVFTLVLLTLAALRFFTDFTGDKNKLYTTICSNLSGEFPNVKGQVVDVLTYDPVKTSDVISYLSNEQNLQYLSKPALYDYVVGRSYTNFRNKLAGTRARQYTQYCEFGSDINEGNTMLVKASKIGFDLFYTKALLELQFETFGTYTYFEKVGGNWVQKGSVMSWIE